MKSTLKRQVSAVSPASAVTIRFLASERFYWLTLGLFALQTVWIAICARYPQAFDEQYHFGIIKIYAGHLSPFLTSQPPHADVFGAVFRDPSYLYHYLMSFPYRLIAHLTANMTAQIISLRFINIGLFMLGLSLFRRVLRFSPASPASINVCMLFVAFTPVMPLLAAQINYDNLFFPLTAASLLLTIRVARRLYTVRQLDLTGLGYWLTVGLIATLVKFAFLPLLLAEAVFIAYRLWTVRRISSIGADLGVWCKRPLNLVLAVLVLLAAALCFQRYGINMLRYHTPLPNCAQVLSPQQCQAYPPYARDAFYHNLHITLSARNYLTYPFVWLYHSMGELIFTISGTFDDFGIVQYRVGSQLILVEVMAWTMFGVGVALFVRYGRWLFSQPAMKLYGVVTGLYISVLFLNNFKEYVYTGIPVAVHGRYILPVLPLLFCGFALMARHAVSEFRFGWFPVKLKLAATLAGIFILLFEGGGFATYILRSDPSWFWPQNGKLQHANDKVRKVLKPVVLDVDLKGTRQPN